MKGQRTKGIPWVNSKCKGPEVVFVRKLYRTKYQKGIKPGFSQGPGGGIMKSCGLQFLCH